MWTYRWHMRGVWPTMSWDQNVNLEGNVSWTDTCKPSDEMSKTYDGTVTAQAERTEGLVTERVIQVHGRRGLSQPHRNTTAWNSQAFFVTMQRSLCINGCSLKANNFCFPYKKQNFFQKYPCAWTLPRVQRYFLFCFFLSWAALAIWWILRTPFSE